jgi:hypothetical protein
MPEAATAITKIADKAILSELNHFKCQSPHPVYPWWRTRHDFVRIIVTVTVGCVSDGEQYLLRR